MLLENFYKIIHIKEREDGKQAIEIELNPGHVLYQGHFPGQPVVPGVCTLQIICHQPAGNSATTAVYPIRKNGRASFQVAGRRHL